MHPHKDSNMFLTKIKIPRLIKSALFSIIISTGLASCSKVPEATSEQSVKAAESAPAAPTISYEQLIVSDDAVGDIFKKRSLETGNAIDYTTRAGVINILDHVLEYPDATGYVKIEKAYSFGAKYILIVSTGENGNGCPATTYAIAVDSKTESVTGSENIDGCSENLESLSDGNKLIVKKDGASSTIYNAEIKQKEIAPKAPNSASEKEIGKVPLAENLITIPKPASDCDNNYEKTLKKLGLTTKVVSVHGPEDQDFNGYACPYRITPPPGTKVSPGSKVTFRSAWEAG